MIFLGKRPHREGPPGPGKVYIIDEANINIRPLSHEPSMRVESFGGGFGWGYTGAGAQQLALALLLEITNDEELSLKLCLSLVEDLIEKLEADCWAIDADHIQNWIKEEGAEQTS